jgi:hypothetical protein
VTKTKDKQHAVSANNPCPFLRALVASGKLADDREPLAKVAAVVATTARAGEGRPVLPQVAIFAIASLANGWSPVSLAGTAWRGLQLNALRGGPLDKKGVGSRILTPRGTVDAKQVSRLRGYATKKRKADGSSELGLDLAELNAFMDANFARAAGRRRMIDRALMNGEWPILLEVMGREGRDGRYLSLREVTDLFRKRSFPDRMTRRLRAGR